MIFITLRRDGDYWQGFIISTIADHGTLRKVPSEVSNDVNQGSTQTSFNKPITRGRGATEVPMRSLSDVVVTTPRLHRV